MENVLKGFQGVNTFSILPVVVLTEQNITVLTKEKQFGDFVHGKAISKMKSNKVQGSFYSRILFGPHEKNKQTDVHAI